MKRIEILVVFITMWATIASHRWYRNSNKATHYEKMYYLEISRSVDYGLESVENMKGWSGCLAEKASETQKYWQCQNALDDLRDFLRDKHCSVKDGF